MGSQKNTVKQHHSTLLCSTKTLTAGSMSTRAWNQIEESMFCTIWIQMPRFYWQSALVKLTCPGIFAGHCTVCPANCWPSRRELLNPPAVHRDPTPATLLPHLSASLTPPEPRPHSQLGAWHTARLWLLENCPESLGWCTHVPAQPLQGMAGARAHPLVRWLLGTLLLLLLCFSCVLGSL